MSNLGNALIVVLASFLVGTFICGIAYLIEKNFDMGYIFERNFR